MDQFFRIILMIVVGGASLIALFTTLALLLPIPTLRVRRHLEEGLGRSLLLGVINFLFFGALSLLFVWLAQQVGGVIAGIFVFLGGLVALVLVLLMLLGLVALADLLGRRMTANGTPFSFQLRGGLLLVLAGMAPFVGWFVFTPLALWTGLGAAIRAFVQRKSTEATPVEESA